VEFGFKDGATGRGLVGGGIGMGAKDLDAIEKLG
jgi:hypothetical protein